jgi:hypothetical protein
MRRALIAAAAGALLAPATALADVQQVLLPGPTPYPSPSPPLQTVGAPPWANLTFKIHARSDQRIRAGVDASGRVVSVRALQRLHLTGTGDYLIVVSAPVLDVRPGPGSESEPGQRRGQILWSGFASKRRLLAADATLRPAAASRFLPLRLEARRDGDRYVLTMTNVTRTSEVAFGGTGKPAELAALLDRTRRDSLAHRRLRPAYVTIQGLVTRRTQKASIAAPLRVEGELRFPAAVKGTINTRRPEGRIVRFGFVLGDEQPLTQRIEVTGGGGDPRLRLEARPDIVVRGLTPPGGAPSWVAAAKRRRLDPRALLARLIDTRMELVRGDQFQAFLANPDPLGSDRTVYVYATSAALARATASSSAGSAGNGALMALLAVGGAVLAAGAALVAWAHS